jgi:hypothetical protein
MDQGVKERIYQSLANINLQDDDDSDRMVIALDFGTTYSGYGCSHSANILNANCLLGSLMLFRQSLKKFTVFKSGQEVRKASQNVPRSSNIQASTNSSGDMSLIAQLKKRL